MTGLGTLRSTLVLEMAERVTHESSGAYYPGLHIDPPLEFVSVVGWYDRPIVGAPLLMSRALSALGAAIGCDVVSSTAYLRAATRPDIPLLPGAWKVANGIGELAISRKPAGMLLETPELSSSREDVSWILLLASTKRLSARLSYYGYAWAIEYMLDERGDSASAIRVSVDVRQFSTEQRGPLDPAAWHAAVEVVRERATRFVDGLVAQLVGPQSPFALIVDTSDVLHADAGSAFMPHWGFDNYASIEEQIRRHRWREAGESRRAKLRGMYWGMLLNPSHLERLGGKARFREQVLSHDVIQPRPNREQYAVDLGDAGLFVRLSPSPLDFSRSCRSGMAVCDEFGVWLYETLRESDLFL